MSEEDVQEEHEEPEAQATEAAAGDGDGDAEVADTVDEIVVEKLADSNQSPQPEGTVGDPIGDAEQHIASLDMDEERRKLQELQDKL